MLLNSLRKMETMAFQRKFACLLALLVAFMVEVPMHSAARFTAADDMKATLDHSGSFAVDMMHYHHVNSPYAKPELTLEQRMEIVVKSSLARGQYFHNLISNETSNSSANAVLTSPLEYLQGFYIMKISLGTPPRPFFPVIDTGSQVVWIQCAPCQSCYTQLSSIFDPATSSTYQTLPCTGNTLCPYLPGTACSPAGTCLYDYIYGMGAESSGEAAYETLTLNTTSGASQAIPNFAFGCSHNSTNSFQGADGVVGFGQGPTSLVAQLGPEIGNVFSYCLVDYVSGGLNKTGSLLLGSPGPVPLQYTPLLTNKAPYYFYYVNLLGITVNGVAVQYPADTFQIHSNGSGGLILDSGTGLSLLNTRAYMPFVNLLQSVITYPMVNVSTPGFDHDLCYNVSSITNVTFPIVVFQFQDVNMVLPQSSIFMPQSNGVTCLAFLNAPTTYPLSIFGSTQQQNFQIAFDRANQRVGFAPRNCSG